MWFFFFSFFLCIYFQNSAFSLMTKQASGLLLSNKGRIVKEKNVARIISKRTVSVNWCWNYYYGYPIVIELVIFNTIGVKPLTHPEKISKQICSVLIGIQKRNFGILKTFILNKNVIILSDSKSRAGKIRNETRFYLISRVLSRTDAIHLDQCWRRFLTLSR